MVALRLMVISLMGGWACCYKGVLVLVLVAHHLAATRTPIRRWKSFTMQLFPGMAWGIATVVLSPQELYMAGYRIPNTEYRIPNTEYQIPNTKYQIPNTEYRIPNTEYQIPNTKYQIPNTKYQIPNTKYRIPNTEYRIPNTKYRIPNTGYRIPNTEYQIPNTEYRIPNTGYRIPNYQIPATELPDTGSLTLIVCVFIFYQSQQRTISWSQIGTFWLDFIIYHTLCCRVVHLDRCSRLRVSHFG
jgi:hypothetical protein